MIKGVHRLRLDALDDEGAGEGTPGDVDPPVRLRVPFALPGEEVVAAVEHASPHRPVAWGRLVELLAPSPSRVAPACAAWGRCGGCVVQHLAYDEQLAWKRSLVEAALRHAGLDGAVEPCVPSPSVLGYRDNAKLVFARDGERVILGAYAPRSHDVVDLAGCAVVAEPLDAVARAIARLATELGVRPYDERTGEGDARYALLRATRDRSTQVTLVVARRGVAAIAELARALRRERPEVRGVVENLQPARTNALVGRTEPDRLLDGDPVLEERLGVRLRLSPRSFFQANHAVAERLYADAAAALALAPAEVALDLYCGVGGIALAAAAAAPAARVIGVEAAPEAVEDARAAAALNGIANARFVCAEAAVAIAELQERVAAAAVDPPRRGLDRPVLDELTRLAPRNLVYVSCNPTTLARDLATLSAHYRITRVTPYDMLPHTPHVETLTTLIHR